MQQRLTALEDESVSGSLASNTSTERMILDQFYADGRFMPQLASNSALSSEKLEELSMSQDTEVLSALAANTATPIDVLYQLSLDRRFERSVKTNPAFGRHIQTHNIGWN
jgi:hypothetical protein